MNIQERAEALGPWYHPIKLSAEYTTVSTVDNDTVALWDAIRHVRDRVDYQGRTVLEVGAMDGMWAFEAEEKWAKKVVAVDIWQNKRFLFAIEARKSFVVPIVNGDVQNLHTVLKLPQLYLDLPSFQIIQCFGMLYHVQNPMLALHQMRRVLDDSGVLILETACWTGCPDEPAARLNRIPWVYEADDRTYWMPNYMCLVNMLSIAGFHPVEKTVVRLLQSEKPAERVIMICRAGPPQQRIDNFGSY